MLFLLILLNTFNLQATLVDNFQYHQRYITLIIEKVEPEDLGLMILTNYNGSEMGLACSRDIGDNQRPLIQFENYYNIHAADFYIDENWKCLELKKFLVRTFEGIDADHPLIIVLDRETQEVSYIKYPEIDPLFIGPEMEEDFYYNSPT